MLCITTMPLSARADDPVVFVSAFKSGDEGAIHAYRFNSKTGQLKLLQRTTGLENPFFMAISPNGRFLYAIDAAHFGSRA